MFFLLWKDEKNDQSWLTTISNIRQWQVNYSRAFLSVQCVCSNTQRLRQHRHYQLYNHVNPKRHTLSISWVSSVSFKPLENHGFILYMHKVLHAGHAERTVINECKRVCVNKEKRGSRLYRLKSNLKPKRRKRLWAALCGRWDISFAKPNLVLSLVRPECAVRKYFSVWA